MLSYVKMGLYYISFLLNNLMVVLIEHQTTINPNMLYCLENNVIWSPEKAMTALGIAPSEFSRYLTML